MLVEKNSENVFSPSREVWRTQMKRGIYSPHRVSRITCIVNKLFSDKIAEYIFKMGVNSAFVESGRTVREYVQSRTFRIFGSTTKMQNTPVDIFRFTVHRRDARLATDYLTKVGEFQVPGRGMIFYQDLIEFTKKEQIYLNLEESESKLEDSLYVNKLSYVVCVLSVQGMGDKIAKLALDLGICVPLITHSSSSDLRDQLGLIRITISPEKEVVHLIMPEQDSENIIKLLLEEGKLDRPGRGFIYKTPVSFGLIDGRLRIGKQEYAASIEQIITAIDQLKGNTAWRKRFDMFESEKMQKNLWLPNDNCEISLVTDEDNIDSLKSAGMKAGATGSTVARVKILIPNPKRQKLSSLVTSNFCVTAQKTDAVVDALLQKSAVGVKFSERIQVLDSPAAYIYTL